MSEAGHLRLSPPLREQQRRRECYVASPLRGFETRQGREGLLQCCERQVSHLLTSSQPRASNPVFPSPQIPSRIRPRLGAEIESRRRLRPPGGRRQDDRLERPMPSDAHPRYSHRFCDFPRFIIQLIAVPAAMPTASVIATVSNGWRSKCLFVL